MEKQRLKKHRNKFIEILYNYYYAESLKKEKKARELFEKGKFLDLLINYSDYIKILMNQSDSIKNRGFDNNMIEFAKERQKIPINHANIKLIEYDLDDYHNVLEYAIMWDEITIFPRHDLVCSKLVKRALYLLKENDKDSSELKEIEKIINNKINMNKNLTNKTLFHFHIGKGGPFNNPGCLKFLGYGLNLLSDIQFTNDIDIELNKDGYNYPIDGIYNTYYGVFIGNQNDYLDLTDKEKRCIEDYLEGTDDENIRLSEYFAEMDINTNIC